MFAEPEPEDVKKQPPTLNLVDYGSSSSEEEVEEKIVAEPIPTFASSTMIINKNTTSKIDVKNGIKIRICFFFFFYGNFFFFLRKLFCMNVRIPIPGK